MQENSSLIREYLNFLSVERALSKNTVSAYERDLIAFSLFVDSHSSLSLLKVTPEILQEYVTVLRKSERSESSIARAIVAIRNCVEFLCKEQKQINLIKDFKPPKSGRRLPKALTVEEITALIDATGVGDDPVSIRNRAIIEVLYATGARISEVVALDLSDVTKLAGQDVLSIKLAGKGGKERIVPVGRYAQSAIDQYVVRVRPINVARNERALFLNSRGTRLTRQSMWKVVAESAQRAGIEQSVSPHAIRHSFATHLLDGGADIRVVQELLGHSSVTTTQIYTLVTIDKLRENYAASHPRARE